MLVEIILQKRRDFPNWYKRKAVFIDKLEDKKETDKILWPFTKRELFSC